MDTEDLIIREDDPPDVVKHKQKQLTVQQVVNSFSIRNLFNDGRFEKIKVRHHRCSDIMTRATKHITVAEEFLYEKDLKMMMRGNEEL